MIGLRNESILLMSKNNTEAPRGYYAFGFGFEICNFGFGERFCCHRKNCRGFREAMEPTVVILVRTHLSD